ncbi:hypothetical protein P4132_05130 [Pseudomonas aeruginosa]|nr:hypothetical protein [Pseudomonas aeruginosa]
MPAMPRIDPPRLVQFAAVLAILAGLLFWGYLLLAPIPAWSRPRSPPFRRPAARTPLNAGSRRLPVRSRCNWRD